MNDSFTIQHAQIVDGKLVKDTTLSNLTSYSYVLYGQMLMNLAQLISNSLVEIGKSRDDSQQTYELKQILSNLDLPDKKKILDDSINMVNEIQVYWQTRVAKMVEQQNEILEKIDLISQKISESAKEVEKSIEHWHDECVCVDHDDLIIGPNMICSMLKSVGTNIELSIIQARWAASAQLLKMQPNQPSSLIEKLIWIGNQVLDSAGLSAENLANLKSELIEFSVNLSKIAQMSGDVNYPELSIKFPQIDSDKLSPFWNKNDVQQEESQTT